MRSIFSSRRQSTIEKPTDLPLPPKEPQPEAEADVTQIKEKRDQMPRMEVFAAKLEETCKTMLAKFDSVTTWSLSVCTVRGFSLTFSVIGSTKIKLTGSSLDFSS